MTKKALITGVTGQDGGYLSQLLLKKGYDVYGAFRRCSTPNTWRFEELGIEKDIKLISFDLIEYSNIYRTIKKVQPDEIYNLGAQSFVGSSFDQPLYTAEIDAMGVLRQLEIIREFNPEIRFYQASTSELYGEVRETPQTELTPFYPRSPYAVAKQFAHASTINYREAYNLHASCGILFNHESPLRGIEFVTRKITSSLAKIYHKQQEILELGNINTMRDWGFAKDYVEAMWLMLQQGKADDYVVATGNTYSVRDFVNNAASAIGYDLEWEGEGVDEFAVDKKSGKILVRINEKFYRPAEVNKLNGDASKIKEKLNWAPSTTFEQLVEMMARADFDRVKNKQRLI